jgi:hypothetical protein
VRKFSFVAVPKPQKPVRNTKSTREWMALVAQLPCLVCGRYGVQIHHCIHGRFSQSRASDYEILPLCEPCHRELHAASKTWVARHGPDNSFLERVREQVERLGR